MRGKKGPKPERPTEIAERENERTAEEIAGAENVVDVGEGQEPTSIPGYKCADCYFACGLLSEMEEHVNGTGHGKFDTAAFAIDKISQVDVEWPDGDLSKDPIVTDRMAPVQPELFSGPDRVYRALEVPLTDEQLAELHEGLGKICSESLAQEELLEATKDKIKALKTSMQEVRAKIRRPFEVKEIECRWEIEIEENAKKLYRLDTDDVIETRALSAEDRSRETEQAEAASAPFSLEDEG